MKTFGTNFSNFCYNFSMEHPDKKIPNFFEMFISCLNIYILAKRARES